MFHPGRSICFRSVLLFLLTSAAGVYSQTSIDVHVVHRTQGTELATATAGPRLSGAGLIRTSTDLVMVPVTITDDRNRPVTGLDRDNFQLFENKQPQEIKNFSSETSLSGKFVRVAARYQVDGSLVATRIWASPSKQQRVGFSRFDHAAAVGQRFQE